MTLCSKKCYALIWFNACDSIPNYKTNYNELIKKDVENKVLEDIQNPTYIHCKLNNFLIFVLTDLCRNLHSGKIVNAF